MSVQTSPNRLLLRCYGYKTKKNRWYGVCLDLNLAVESDSPEGLKKKMSGVIVSYLETVLNTEDKASIPQLLKHRAPLLDWLTYYKIRIIMFINRFPGNFTFNEVIPFPSAHGC